MFLHNKIWNSSFQEGRASRLEILSTDLLSPKLCMLLFPVTKNWVMRGVIFGIQKVNGVA